MPLRGAGAVVAVASFEGVAACLAAGVLVPGLAGAGVVLAAGVLAILALVRGAGAQVALGAEDGLGLAFLRGGSAAAAGARFARGGEALAAPGLVPAWIQMAQRMWVQRWRGTGREAACMRVRLLGLLGDEG